MAGSAEANHVEEGFGALGTNKPNSQRCAGGRPVTRRAFVVSAASLGVAASSLLAGCAGSARSSSIGQQADESFANDLADRSESAGLSNDPNLSSAPLEQKDAAGNSDDPNRLIARLALISDTHLCWEFEPSVPHMRSALQALSAFDPKPDAIIINGDVTNHGQPEEYDLVEQLAGEAGFKFPDSFICTMGNHEQRGYHDDASPESFQEQRDLFMQRCNLGKLYYDLDVNGVHLVMLGPDADPQSWKTVRYSKEQLEWLDGLLESDAREGKPAFVFSHQPASDTVIHTYEGEYAHDALESSAELLSVVQKYRNAVLVTAHTHSPADFYRPNDDGPLFVCDSAVAYLRNDPHLDWTDDAPNYSRGVLADVYANRIEFLSWDFMLGAEADTGSYTLT